MKKKTRLEIISFSIIPVYFRKIYPSISEKFCGQKKGKKIRKKKPNNHFPLETEDLKNEIKSKKRNYN